MADTSRLFFPSLRFCIVSPIRCESVRLQGNKPSAHFPEARSSSLFLTKFSPDSPKPPGYTVLDAVRAEEGAAQKHILQIKLCIGWVTALNGIRIHWDFAMSRIIDWLSRRVI